MSCDETEHVRIELSEVEYERVRACAREQGISLEEASHQALIEWIERQHRADPDDRAFTVLDELDEEALPASAATDVRGEDDIIEERHGSDESFTLADDPST